MIEKRLPIKETRVHIQPSLANEILPELLYELPNHYLYFCKKKTIVLQKLAFKNFIFASIVF